MLFLEVTNRIDYSKSELGVLLEKKGAKLAGLDGVS